MTSVVLASGAFASACACANEILDAWWRESGNDLVTLGVPEDHARRIFLNIDDFDDFAEGPGTWVYEFKIAGDVPRNCN